MLANAGKGLEIRESAESDVYFAGRATEFVSADAIEEIRRQFFSVDKFFEGEMGIDAGRNDIGVNFFSVFQGDAGDPIVFYDDVVDWSVGADFDAKFACRGSDGVGDRAGATTTEAPGAEGAIDFAHVMVQ